MRFLRKRNIIILLSLLVVLYAFTGPVWIRNKPYITQDYYKTTIERLQRILPLKGEGNLQAGYSQHELNLETGQPIMGFSDRKPFESEGILSQCYAKSLTVAAGGKMVSLVAVDIMLLMGDIVDDIYKETGLQRDEIYFTATHTHSGYGGWVDHPVFEFFYGKYNKKYYDNLKNTIVRVIMDSRKSLLPVKMSLTRVAIPQWLENRIYNHNPAPAGSGYHDINPYLSALSFFDAEHTDKLLYVFTAYAAHATAVRKDVHMFSADYPGELCASLKELTGAEGVMFAAGSVGDARADTLNYDGAQEMGEDMSAILSEKILTSSPVDIDRLISLYLPVDLPEARFSMLGANWGMFPLLAWYLFDRPVHLSYLQLGKIALVGVPADIAGELTTEEEEKYPLLFTSFNGSWKGYFTREDTYLNRDTYSTRSMGLAGPQAGDYIINLADMIYRKYTADNADK